jgi:hypothetical protein
MSNDHGPTPETDAAAVSRQSGALYDKCCQMEHERDEARRERDAARQDRDDWKASCASYHASGKDLLNERLALIRQRDELLEVLDRARQKLRAYVGVCSGDKELTQAVLPMADAAIAAVRGPAALLPAP